MKTSAVLIAIALCLGCSSTREVPDSGPNTGQDAAPNDTGTPVDTGMENDTGTPNDTGPGVDAGPGDTGPTDGAVGGACVNAADEAIHTNGDVDTAVADCALGCFGAEVCTAECVANDTGLSAACAGCYGAATACTLRECFTECAGGNSPDCDACRDAMGCTAEFETCSGRT